MRRASRGSRIRSPARLLEYADVELLRETAEWRTSHDVAWLARKEPLTIATELGILTGCFGFWSSTSR